MRVGGSFTSFAHVPDLTEAIPACLDKASEIVLSLEKA